MGENNCKITNKGSVSKIYTQLNTRKKVCVGGRIRPKQTFLQRTHKDGQQTHEKMLNIAHYYRNANQSYNEVSPHTSKNGHH